MFASKKEAVEQGKILLEKLKGKGWQLQVWQNFGCWRCVARLHGLTVAPVKHRNKIYYVAYLSTVNELLGEPIGGSEYFHSTNPNEAVQNRLKSGREFIKKCNRMMKEIEEGLK